MNKTIAERMWAKIDISEWERDPRGHWWWTGSTNSTGKRFGEGGYGGLLVQENGKWRKVLAHRLMYEMLVGPIPDGMTIDHLCRIPRCVNPDHLEPVTHKENLYRGKTTIASINGRKTHCKRGHPLSGANLMLRRYGRECRQCATDGNRRRYLQRLADR